MTVQEIFDKVLFALRKQGVAAGDWTGSHFTCSYKDSQGRRCAVGHLIPDEYISLFVSNQPLICYSKGLIQKLGFEEHLSFLRQLQALHDSYLPYVGAPDRLGERSMHLWEIRMKALADNRGLIYTPPESAPEAATQPQSEAQSA